VEQLLAAIDASEKDKRVPAALAGALRTLIADAGHDMEKVKANVQEWFDGSMDRVAGWYKRRAQFLLLIIGAVVVVGVNVDTLEIVRTLSNDSAVRAAVVAAAETYARENPRPGTPANQTAATPGQPASPQGQPAGNMSPVGPEAPRVSSAEATADVKRSVADVVTQLNTLGLPVGWRYYDRTIDGPIIERADPAARRKYLLEQRIWPQWPDSQTSSGQSWAVRFGAWQQDWRDQLASHLLGWILTAFALSFGAPFWFDTLNKIMVIRSTVKPREKSQEEASEDRQRAEPAQTVRIEVATKP
jgi:hypothetical protein